MTKRNAGNSFSTANLTYCPGWHCYRMTHDFILYVAKTQSESQAESDTYWKPNIAEPEDAGRRTEQRGIY